MAAIPESYARQNRASRCIGSGIEKTVVIEVEEAERPTSRRHMADPLTRSNTTPVTCPGKSDKVKVIVISDKTSLLDENRLTRPGASCQGKRGHKIRRLGERYPKTWRVGRRI